MSPMYPAEDPPPSSRAVRIPVAGRAELRLGPNRKNASLFFHPDLNKIGMSETPFRDPGRRAPAKGVHLSSGGPNWVLLTVCTKHRERWLAQEFVEDSLHQIWQDTATAWLVSDYLLMPDHLHLFCAPRDLKFTVERWISFWKDRFTKTHPAAGEFQPGGFHHRLRRSESYAQKWQYVLENPVRAGLVAHYSEWPFAGRVHELRWSGK